MQIKIAENNAEIKIKMLMNHDFYLEITKETKEMSCSLRNQTHVFLVLSMILKLQNVEQTTKMTNNVNAIFKNWLNTLSLLRLLNH